MKNLFKSLKWFILIIFIMYSLIPLIMIFFTSLKTEQELASNVIGVPYKPNFENYRKVWIEYGFWIYTKNSFIIVLPTILLCVILSISAGYALSKLNFIGRTFLFNLFLVGIMVPLVAIMVPIYINLSKLHLLDSYFGMILTQVGVDLPFGIYLMYTFFSEVPDEILEAARIDGASELNAMFRIAIPMAKPGILSLCLIEFMFGWKSYVVPLFVNSKDNLKPLTVALSVFQLRFSTSYTLVAAASIIIIAPILIVFLLTQKSFVQGLTMGSIK